MLTLGAVAAQPACLQSTVRIGDGRTLRYRPLVDHDVEALTAFLESLSAATRHFWLLERYDRVAAEEFCHAIGRYDKLRMVADHPADPTSGLVALFEFSFGIPSGDLERFLSYGIILNEDHDCRFGPCVRDTDQQKGVASALMAPTLEIARRFGKSRLLLWGGVLADNQAALTFYRKQGFSEVGRFTDQEGYLTIDMLRSSLD